MPSSNSIINGITQIRFGRNTLSRLFSDINEYVSPLHSKIEFSEDKTDSFKSLKFDKVSFAYPGIKKNVLNKVSLEVFENDSIGLIGSSGSGKTTLVDLFLGLLEPNEGILTYNNQPINGNLEKLRAQTAYLPQQVFLTDDTLRNNVALGVDIKKIDDHKVVDSLNRARLSELLETVPNGLDSILGEGGIMISGGQRQRISLARAFYHGRKILVMDESTSALDDVTESEIISEIKQLKGRVTLIVIAHSFSTIQHCKHVYKIESGKIVRQVNHNE
jgi:ABC-type multidrug transport system fused ATPase/permease subunit